MRMMTAEELADLLDYPSLIDAIDEMFREGCETPLRHVHDLALPGGSSGALLLMPAWREGGIIGIKIVTVVPDNGTRGLPAVQAVYLVMDASTGSPLAMLDGEALTARRTAAASALAARYLARQDASTLGLFATGALAPKLIGAHAAVRPIKTVLVWGRTPEKAEAVAAQARADGFDARAVQDREEAVRDADIVSCATLSNTPLVEGAWLKPGAHVDLVGAFKTDMRESDDAVMARGSVYVDTWTGGLAEAGDVVQAIEAGALTKEAIRGDLFDLARGAVAGRQSDDEITVFKSVGTALEDLAAAALAMGRDSSLAGGAAS